MAAALLPLLAACTATLPAVPVAPMIARTPAPAGKPATRRKSKPFSSLKSPKSRLKRIRSVTSDVRAAFNESCERNAVDDATLLGIDANFAGERVRLDFEDDSTLGAKDMPTEESRARLAHVVPTLDATT